MASCIYTGPSGLCAGTAPLSGEHYLPRGLGKFRGYEELIGKVCRDCNERFSKLDEILLSHGPEALLRLAHGIQGRKKHRRRDLSHDRSHGLPPIEVTALLPNESAPSRMEILSRNRAQPRRELTFVSAETESVVVTVPHRVKTRAELQGHLRKAGVAGRKWAEMRVGGPAEDRDFFALIEQHFGKIQQSGNPPDYSAYPAGVRAVASIRLPPEYHRAIAKIGFHFFVQRFSPPLTGFEAGFDHIKRLIYEGGEQRLYVTTAVASLDRTRNPRPPWTHVLCAGWIKDEMFATVQLFAGSDLGMQFIAGSDDRATFSGNMSNKSLEWRVRLGRTALAYPWGRRFDFVGYNKRRDGFDGEVQEFAWTGASWAEKR